MRRSAWITALIRFISDRIVERLESSGFSFPDFAHKCAPRIKLLALPLSVVISGCGDSRSGAEPGLESVLTRIRIDNSTGTPESEESVFDFGWILADKQSLRHEYVITNRSPRPLRLLRAEAMTPCCSAVGTLSKEPIPPGGTGKVRVVLHTGTQTGEKRVEFVIETDSAEEPMQTLTLKASLLSEWEATIVGETAILHVGQAGRMALRVTARRLGDKGRLLPDAVTAEALDAPRFVTEGTTRTVSGGMEESSRDVSLDIPASADVGRHTGALRFSWVDGHSEPFGIAWEVRPWVVTSPSCLVIESGDQDQEVSVRLTSQDKPFSLKSVSGPALVGDFVANRGLKPSRSLDLKITLNSSRIKSLTSSEVAIETDHPDQPRVSLTIVVVPSRPGRPDAAQ